MIMHTETICAPATSAGGAIGVVRVSGSDAMAIVNKVFSKDISKSDGYTVHYGRIYEYFHQEKGRVIDDVLVTVFRQPHSYTGEDGVEISHHGSAYIQRMICQSLIDAGCKMAAPGEFTQRAYLNGKMDLTQAEAVADLIAAQNAKQHMVAMQQMRGSVSTRLSDLRDKLLHLTSLLELELDFSDHEELEFANRDELSEISEEVRTEINRLLTSFAQGNAIKKGIPVAIIGAPNVGKSTLLNALLEDDKAIVSDIQGTTRDIIEDTINIDGYLFRFIDTAGIRSTEDTIEKMGIERSMKAAENAMIIILLAEPGVPFIEVDSRNDQTVLRIVNKSDTFQAINGLGIPELMHNLVEVASSISTDDVVITSQRHQESLSLAMEDIDRSIISLIHNYPGDLIAEDLRLCISHLSDIVGGTITTDEVLGNIFRHFCIGK